MLLLALAVQDRCKLPIPEDWTVEDLLDSHESKPHNPLLAGAFFRSGDIESWGRGIDNIRKACREHGADFPIFKARQTTMTVEFSGAVPEDAGQVTAQVGSKSALSRHQVDIMRKCQNESSLVDLMSVTGRSDRTKFRNQVLDPMLEAGFVAMTIPDKPTSRLQKYRLTGKGCALLENLKDG